MVDVANTKTVSGSTGPILIEEENWYRDAEKLDKVRTLELRHEDVERLMPQPKMITPWFGYDEAASYGDDGDVNINVNFVYSSGDVNSNTVKGSQTNAKTSDDDTVDVKSNTVKAGDNSNDSERASVRETSGDRKGSAKGEKADSKK